MSSFTKALVVRKKDKKFWVVEWSFDYCIGDKNSEEKVTIPQGFITDFASVPRIFWIVFPPDGSYTQASVVHDYLYYKHKFSRKKSDAIFYEAMGVLKVANWKRFIIHQSVRRFGWMVWNTRNNRGINNNPIKGEENEKI